MYRHQTGKRKSEGSNLSKSWISRMEGLLSEHKDRNLEMEILIYDLFLYIHGVLENYGEEYDALEKRAVDMGLVLPDELRIQNREE